MTRDHKELGKELEIFAFDDEIGRGLPLWLPNGTIVRDELEKLMRELEFEAGFQRVATPHLAKRELYVRSGHLPYFEEHMFPAMAVGENGSAFCLRPMNCPHHHRVFAVKKRSYRELPLRLAEYGHSYRYEDSGAVSGLLRVRGMCMNDAHIYCTREQIVAECEAVLAMHRRVYDILGIKPCRLRLSIRGNSPNGAAKYADDLEAWRVAEELLRHVLVASGLDFEEAEGEAAFYGPKIDFQFSFAGGREETASTLQLDFGSPQRLDLEYVGPDGAMHRPFIIHRAPLGTHERFVALLLEHYDGAFPTWLAPRQLRVLPISWRFADYGRKIVGRLRKRQVRAELDDSGESLSKRIGQAARERIPNPAIVGAREEQAETVALRVRGDAEPIVMPLDAFENRLLSAIAERRLD
jgi:threonyl-tRNA synthetase